MGDRGNDAQCAARSIRSSGLPQGGGGRSPRFVGGLHGEVGAQAAKDIFGRYHVLAAPLLAGPKRHLFDEAQLSTVADGIVR